MWVYVVPMERIERSTSPLPRECSTTELHGHDYENQQAVRASILPYLRLVTLQCLWSG